MDQEKNNSYPNEYIEQKTPQTPYDFNTVVVVDEPQKKRSRKKILISALVLVFLAAVGLVVTLLINRAPNATENSSTAKSADAINTSKEPDYGLVSVDGEDVFRLTNDLRPKYVEYITSRSEVLAADIEKNSEIEVLFEGYTNCTIADDACRYLGGVVFETESTTDIRVKVYQTTKYLLENGWVGSKVVNKTLKSVTSFEDIEFNEKTGMLNHQIQFAKYEEKADSSIVSETIFLAAPDLNLNAKGISFGIEISAYTKKS